MIIQVQRHVTLLESKKNKGKVLMSKKEISMICDLDATAVKSLN